MTAERSLNAGEWSVLALVRERPAHGWALANALGADGPIGAVWSLTKPLVYRALETLEHRGLVEVAAAAASTRGPTRTIYRATAAGADALDRWLREPVRHVRDVRPDLLLKLLFAGRTGRDPGPLLAAQRTLLEELVHGLEDELAGAGPDERLLLRFRVETARAALRFVEATAGSPAGPPPTGG